MNKIQPVISVICMNSLGNTYKEKSKDTKGKKKDNKEFSEILNYEMSKFDLKV